MKFAKRLLMVAGAIAIAGLLSAALVPSAVHAVVATLVQVVPGATTHVGQNESQLVSLHCGTVSGPYCGVIDPQGTQSATAYVVPAGYTLIITDWEWFGNNGSAAGNFTEDVLQGATGGSFAQSFALVSASSIAYNHEHYAGGIRVGSGVTIQDFLAAGGIGQAYIQGYLVPN